MDRLLLLCLGHFDGEKDVPLIGFLPITQEELDNGLLTDEHAHAAMWPVHSDLVRVFRASVMRKAMMDRAGSVYSVEGEGSSIRPNTNRMERLWPDSDLRLQWAATAEGRRRAAIGRKEAKILAKTNELQRSLGPVREAYKRSVGTNRTHLLAAVVEYITK